MAIISKVEETLSKLFTAERKLQEEKAEAEKKEATKETETERELTAAEEEAEHVAGVKVRDEVGRGGRVPVQPSAQGAQQQQEQGGDTLPAADNSHVDDADPSDLSVSPPQPSSMSMPPPPPPPPAPTPGPDGLPLAH